MTNDLNFIPSVTTVAETATINMTPTSSTTEQLLIADLEQQIYDLQCAVAQQEFDLTTLNQVVVDQQQQLMALEKKIELLTLYLKSNLNSSNIALESEETLPPHY